MEDNNGCGAFIGVLIAIAIIVSIFTSIVADINLLNLMF